MHVPEKEICISTIMDWISEKLRDCLLRGRIDDYHVGLQQTMEIQSNGQGLTCLSVPRIMLFY